MSCSRTKSAAERSPFRLSTTWLLGVLIWLLPRQMLASDWPQFRGPNRDNAWNATGVLKSFPAAGLKIRWRMPVGPGWSSPVVAGGRVYLTDMRLEKPKAWEQIRCFKESTGMQLWSYATELVYPEWAFIPEHGGGPAATPIIEGGRIYSLGRNGRVDCRNARDGKVIWEVALGQKYGSSGRFVPGVRRRYPQGTYESKLVVSRLRSAGRL